MKIKVLLVDDEREFVDALAERLEIRDFEILKAYDGDEALGKIADTDTLEADLTNVLTALRFARNPRERDLLRDKLGTGDHSFVCWSGTYRLRTSGQCLQAGYGGICRRGSFRNFPRARVASRVGIIYSHQPFK